jgi:hypothetical protein
MPTTNQLVRNEREKQTKKAATFAPAPRRVHARLDHDAA